MAGWSCAACGLDNADGMRFCGHCGTPAAAAPPVQTWSCRACGTANLPTMVFCGGCGAKSQPERAEEMRLVTALFADLSGFTTLADTLAVEDLHDVIRPLVAGLARIAERYGGFIEKYAGDALLVVFGAPVTHEDDAQRALLAAMEMHAALPALIAQLGPNAAHLTIHIGVNTGRVIAGRIGSEGSSDYAVLGDSVILAQRLESACPPGETYVGASTYALTSDDFEMESVGPLVLKGKLAPVEAYRLVGRRRAGTSGSRPLVGREHELVAAEDGLARGAVTTVVGEPGAGKSRLLAELRHRATARGVQWLAARCLSYGASLAYWPLADLLRQELQLPLATSPDEASAALSRALPAAAVPGARRLLGLEVGGLPETARREVHDAVTAWLRERAERGPVVLVLEDLHWCDRSTIEALAELVRVGDASVAVLLATREEGRARAAEVAGEAEHQVVEVGPLDEAGTVAVAGSVLGRLVAPDLGALLLERTGGNPLHVVELARSLSESDALVETVQGWDLRPGWDAAAVPTTIERVFATRVDALPPAAAAVLQLASVIGRKARLSILQEVHDGSDLDAALQTLTAAAMLEPDTHTGENAFTFSHALLQDAVYARMLRKRRRELHRRVADAARRLYGEADDSIELLARHLYLAEAGEEAVEPLLRAGRRAARLFANDEAAVHLERAVEVLERIGDDQRLTDALLELAEVQQLRGAYDASLTLYERARAVRGEVAEARGGAAAVLRKLGRYSDALAVLEQAPHPLPVPLLLEHARSSFHEGKVAAALEDVRVALASCSDDAARSEALLELVSIETQVDHPRFALSHGARALRLLEESSNLRGQVQAHRMIGDAHRRLGDHRTAAVHLQRAIALAEQLGDVEEAGGSLLNLGILHRESDAVDLAIEVTRAAAQRFERLGHGSGRALSYNNLADYTLAQGDAQAAREWAEQSLTVATSIGYRRQAAVAALTLAEIDVAAGSPATALDRLPAVRAAFAELGAMEMVEYCDQVADQAREHLSPERPS